MRHKISIIIIILIFALIALAYFYYAIDSKIGSLGSLISAIVAVITFSIMLKSKAKLNVIEIEKESRFYMEVNPPPNNIDEIIDTILELRIKMRNSGNKRAIIKPEFRIEIKSERYKKSMKPDDRKKFRFLTGQHKSSWRDIENIGNNGEINLEPDSGWECGSLFFRLGIRPPDKKELKCNLKLWDYDHNSCNCKVQLNLKRD